MPRGIDQDDVWKAADALLIEGARPTIERIRQKIGRGSPNTVSPLLDSWFEQLGGRLRNPSGVNLPKEVPDPVKVAAKHFWEVALATARDEKLTEIDAEKAIVATRAAELAEREDALVRREEALGARAAVLEDSMERALRQAETAGRRVRELETLLDRREGELSQTRASLAEHEQAANEARIHFEADRRRFEADRNLFEDRYQASERRAAQEIDRAREEARELEETVARQEEELLSQRSDLESSRQLVVQLREQLVGLAKQIERQESEMASRQSRNAVLEAQWAERVQKTQEALVAVQEQMRRRDLEQTEMLRDLVASSKTISATRRVRRRGALVRPKKTLGQAGPL